MAKVELPEGPDGEPEESGRPQQADSAIRTAVRRRRWWPRLLLLVLISGVFLPTALTIFGGFPAILKKIHPQFAAAVQFRTIQLHWWAPVEVTDLTLADLSKAASSSTEGPDHTVADGDVTANHPAAALEEATAPLLQVSSLRTREPLWKLALHLGRDTSIVLEKPQLNLILRERGSNLDETLSALFGSDTQKSSDPFPIQVVVQDAEVSVRSESPGVPPLFSRVNATWSSINSAAALPAVRLAAEIQPGTAAVSSNTQSSGSDRGPEVAKLAADLQQLATDFPVIPLESFSGLPELNTSPQQEGTAGKSSLHLEIRPIDNSERQAIRLAARDVDVRLLQPVWRIVEADVLCEGLVSCDLQAELAGSRLRDGLAGRVLFSGSRLRVRQSHWTGGEWLELGETEASGAVAIAHDGILLNQVSVKSDILTATGAGELRTPVQPVPKSEGTPAASLTNGGGASDAESAHRALIDGRIDLARISRMLPRTLGLRPDVSVEAADITFHASAEPAVSSGDGSGESRRGPRWQATLVNERIEAMQGGQRISTASEYKLDAAGPLVLGFPHISGVRLSGDFGNVTCAPLADRYRLSGQINPEQLWQQLTQFIEMPQPGIRGDIHFETTVLTDELVTSLTDVRVASDDLQVTSARLQLHHHRPVVSMLDGALHAEGSGAAIRTLLAPWHSASWLAATSSVIIDVAADPDQRLQLRAIIQPRPIAAAARTPVRSVAQSSQLSSRAAPAVQTQTSTRPASASSASALQIDQAIVELDLTAQPDADLCEVRRATIQLPGLASIITGSIRSVDADLDVNLSADTQYDLNVLCSRLLPGDPSIRFDGRGRDTFSLQGMWVTDPSRMADQHTAGKASQAAAIRRPLTASGRISWDSGTLWGLQIGSAALAASLENGILRTEPLQCRVNSGELNVMAQWDLARERVQLATGSRIQNLELTPQLCQQWIGWLAPLLTDAARISGVVSGRIERFDYHLAAPENSDIAAVLTVSSGSAEPGPSLIPLLQAMDVIRRADGGQPDSLVRPVTLPPQDVPLQLQQGFIVHQGLTVELNGYRAVSSGGVGLNRQVQLTLEIPLEKSTGGAGTRTLRVPIRGTMDRPVPDTTGLLQNLGTQALEQKLNNQLDRQLNKLLNKL